MVTMYLRRFLCWVSILGLIGGVTAKLHYAFSVPVLLAPGENNTACMNFLNVEEPLDLHVSLQIFGESYTMFTDEIPAGDTFRCKEFKVPNVESEEIYYNRPAITMVAIGQDHVIVERHLVAFRMKKNFHLIQLDSPMYKPGQKVRFRVISIDSRLQPVNETYSSIHIMDPDATDVVEWHNLTAEHGVLTLEFKLPNDALLGKYVILLRTSYYGTDHSFKVKEDALPRFSLTVDAPREIFIQDNDISISVSARDPLGQGVPGRLNGSLCIKYNYYDGRMTGPCIDITGEMDSQGTLSRIIDLNELELTLSDQGNIVKLKITATEEGTEAQETEIQFIKIKSCFPIVTFEHEVLQTFYKPGIPYFVAMMLQDCDGNPMKNALIELLVEEDNVQNVTTDANGKAQCVIDMSRYDSLDLLIKAFYIQDEYDGSSQNTSDIYSYLYLLRFRSRTGDYIQAYAPQLELDCGKTYDIKVHYLFSREGLLEGARNISFYYLMVSEDKIVKSGERLVDVSSTLQGQFSFSVTMPSQYSSSIDIMVYCMLQSEVLSSHVHLITEKCFKNQVSLSFSASEGASGSDVNLMLKADPKSVCGLQIIDSSILLHLNNWPLTPEKMEHVLYHPDELVARWNQFTWDPDRLCTFNASFYDSPVPYDDEGFANLEFQHAGLIFATNASLQNPQMCEKIRGAARHVSMQKNMYLQEKYYKYYNNEFHGQFPDITDLRHDLPEIWSFEMVTIGESGSASLTLRVPEGSARWEASMFCLSEETGFGMTMYPSTFTSTL